MTEDLTRGGVNEPVETRYRLMWYDAVYQPGEIKVVAYGEDGRPAAEKTVRTAGRPHHIESREMEFSVSGAASYRASANGDPTCLYIFHKPVMPAFNGMLTVIVCSGDAPGKATLTVRAKGLRPASLDIEVR